MIHKLTPHQADVPFTMIPRELARDRNLSIKARGVLVYLLSLPSDWDVSQKRVAKEIGGSVTLVNKAVKELQQYG